MSGIPPPQSTPVPEVSLATQYSGPYLNEFIPYDEYHESIASSNGEITLTFKADDKNYDYLGTVSAVIMMPEVNIDSDKPMLAAWPLDVIPRSIHSVTMRSPSISSGQVSYTISGEEISKVLHHYRDFDISKNEVMGNIPELLEFSRYIPAYSSTIKLPVFWNNYHQFPLNLCKEDITITMKLKSPKDLLRLRAVDGDNVMDIPYNNPSKIDKIYQLFSITPNRIEAELEYRVSKTAFVKEPSNALYQHRLLPRFQENISDIESINSCHALSIDNLNRNVLGFMWHLQPVYLDSKKNEMKINAYGDYSLDPLSKSKYDPVSITEIGITRTNGTIEPTIKIRGSSSKMIDAIGLSERMSPGHHIYTFGTNPFEGLKFSGKDIKSVTFKCTSSDRFVTSTSKSTDENDNILDILIGKKKNVELNDAPIELNLDSSKSTSSMMNTRDNYNCSQEINSIGYRLVVYTIISTEMTIEDGKVKFK